MNELPRLASAIGLIFALVTILIIAYLLSVFAPGLFSPIPTILSAQKPKLWHAPDTSSIPLNPEGNLIRYGRDLIVRTSLYLGPKGTVKSISNGMNCQNCHLEAGTKPFGNNYGAVASLYPRFRARSGERESIERRINDCLMRSLNGEPLDTLSREMKAMVAYMRWLGKDVPHGEYSAGAGLISLPWLPRAADTVAGRKLYMKNCQICHGSSGQGQRLSKDGHFIYPPLWGENSFNTGAGLYRISSFARYIFANMPNGATHEKPTLKAEEAWDIAAYVVSRPRPEKKFPADWPKLELKPVDHPIGPFADKFSADQHKYGPFPPIEEALTATK
ncbi:MAG TPA: c-type cytochrome [Cyclobacteriaceae bacterium]|nr:c-type cytochrome [Cyclobacteriaceae bacterium]